MLTHLPHLTELCLNVQLLPSRVRCFLVESEVLSSKKVGSGRLSGGEPLVSMLVLAPCGSACVPLSLCSEIYLREENRLSIRLTVIYSSLQQKTTDFIFSFSLCFNFK